MRKQTTSYACADCGTAQLTENGQSPKVCPKCDGTKFIKGT